MEGIQIYKPINIIHLTCKNLMEEEEAGVEEAIEEVIEETDLQ